MRTFALVSMVVALGFAAGVSSAAETPGTLSLEAVNGHVTVKGQGAVLGRLTRGTLQIIDLSPGDRFFPRINGVARGRAPFLRGRNVTFYVPGGRYRVVVRGDGISLSTRGNGFAVLLGAPDPAGFTGVWGIGGVDCHVAVEQCEPVPVERFRVAFGGVLEDPTRPASTATRSATSAP